ncbi:MAG: hypothetical protein ACK4IX_00625 [Candidatus Sericytochromatia bacterium]
MKKILILIMLLVSLVASSQTNFDKGFEDGYKKGYCQDQGNCIAPIPPIAPIPNVYESTSSYQDGYNRGFKIGLEKQTLESSNQNNNKGNYKTAKGEFINFTSENTNTVNNELVSKEDWNNVGDLIKQISESLEFDEVLYEQKIISKEKYLISRDYYKELQNLVNYINKNKLTIVKKRNEYNFCINSLNDLNKRIKS